MFQFVGGIFITNDDCMGMLLQAADGPHVVDWLFDTVTKGAGLVVTIHHDHHLLGIHHRADTNGQSGLGNQVDIIIEEATICNCRRLIRAGINRKERVGKAYVIRC